MPDEVVGIVTVTFNSAGVIGPFMASLEQQSCRSFRLYVVDNDSTDATLEHIASERFTVVTIANQNNVGVAEGNNQGVRAALADGCQYVLLLNNDTEFVPDLVATLLREIEAHNADMIAPKVMLDFDRKIIWYAGGFFAPRRGYSGEHYGLGEKDVGQFDLARRVEYTPSCCVLIRREVFDKVGFIDPEYFLYFDDTDFCYRALRHNIQLWYTPATVLYHKVGSLSGGENSPFFVRHNTRNHVYFLLKNLGVRGAMFLPAYQALLLYKWITRTYSTQSFRVAEHAFWEGIRMFWTSRELHYGI